MKQFLERRGIAVFAFVLLLLSTFVHGQNIRWDLGAPGSAGAATTQGAGLPYLVAIPGVTLNWCNYPANAVPCTNFANTYPTLSSNSPCATNAQVVLQGSSTCQATGDAFGNLGAYVAPNASCGGLTCYAYTLTANGASTGPYLWVWGGTNMVSTAVTYSSTPVFPVTAQIQLFTITLTGNAVATMTIASNVTAPAEIFFQITQDSSGGHTFTWPSGNTVGGCTIGSAANQVTTEEFIWNGVTATAVSGGCVVGSGPAVVVGSLNVSGLTASKPTCTDANKNLSSSCNTVNGITVNGQTIPPGGSGNVNAGAAAHSMAINQGDNNAQTGVLLAVDQVGVGRTSADPVPTSLPNCVDTAGQHLNYTTSTHALSCGASSAGIQASSITVLGSPVSVSANTPTTVMTKSVTMPLSGCPCRALVSYGTYLNTANSGIAVIWIGDGSDQFATSQILVTGSSSAYGTSASSMSTSTYANGVTVTFTETIEASNSGGVTVEVSNNTPSAQATWMNVAIFNSN